MGANRSAADDFDRLVRSTVSGSSRRGFLRLLFGSSVSAGIATVAAPLVGRASGSTSPIDPTTGQPYFVCEPSCGPCHICVHAFFEQPTCLPQCDPCSFCNTEDETCISTCGSCEKCKAGSCQSTCPNCQKCDGDTCRPCGEGPCERCENGICVGCQPGCETCDPQTNTCQSHCQGGRVCCAGTCQECCGECNRATGTCKDVMQGRRICFSDEEVCCGDECHNLHTDKLNCGRCGHRCGVLDCCEGACVDLDGDDSQNCGACGRDCDVGFVCCRGVCTSQEVADQDGLECCPKLRLCDDRCCPKGAHCQNGQCICGAFGEGELCTDDQGQEMCCDQGERCCNGACIPFNEGCCPPGEHVAQECGGCCPDGQVCKDGICQDLQCEYPETSCYDENGAFTVCCDKGMICGDDNSCHPECYGGICGPDQVCCDSVSTCVPAGECCPVGSSSTGAQPGKGPKCCPNDTQMCCCECRPLDQLCFCDPC